MSDALLTDRPAVASGVKPRYDTTLMQAAWDQLKDDPTKLSDAQISMLSVASERLAERAKALRRGDRDPIFGALSDEELQLPVTFKLFLWANAGDDFVQDTLRVRVREQASQIESLEMRVRALENRGGVMVAATVLVREAARASDAMVLRLRERLEAMRTDGRDTDELIGICRFWRSLVIFEFDRLRHAIEHDEPFDTEGAELSPEDFERILKEGIRRGLGLGIGQ